MKKSESIGNKIVPIIFAALLIIIWELAAQLGNIPRYILPSPSDIVVTLVTILPSIKNHIITTLKEAMTGFFISVLFALTLAVLMDNIKILRKCIYPILIVSQTVPTIILAPLFAMWFGYGMLPKIIVVVLVCFFPIVISLMDGLDSVDGEMVNLLVSMGASKVEIFKNVKFPAAMVNFFSGLRIAATYTIIGAVIGEWMGGESGLGVYMLRVKHSYALDKVFAVILIIVLLSMMMFGTLYLIQYILMPWNRSNERK